MPSAAVVEPAHAVRGPVSGTEVVLPFKFDWKSPDYTEVFAHRIEKLAWLRAHPSKFQWLRDFYKEHPAQMICDWGCTYDPRNLERGLPALVPFILFPKQIDWIDFAISHWRASKPGLTEKSRDCGVSWLSMALSVHLCLYNHGMAIGFGSAKADKVDRTSDPDCLFFKGRFFLQHLPAELRGGWNEAQHSAYMRLQFPLTSASITGEAGDNIGRGGRKSIYFVDEAAHLERPQLIESSLLSTTNCRLDLSSVAGMANPFAQKRHLGKVDFFTFHWRDDPRKDQAWYDQQVRQTDAVTLAQDVDINYLASTVGAVLPNEWVQVAVGAHLKLGLEPTGIKRGGFDVADQGPAMNALAARHGFLLTHLEQWTGKGSDIYASVIDVVNRCDDLDLECFYYDADGVGSGVRGDARAVNEERRNTGRRWITAEPFHGSGSVEDPSGEMVAEKINKDFFKNLKAQSWWSMRIRFMNTWRALRGEDYDPDNIISLDPALPDLGRLLMELVQPTYTRDTSGKIVVDKTPEGTPSPNLADAVMICFAPVMGVLETWSKL